MRKTFIVVLLSMLVLGMILVSCSAEIDGSNAATSSKLVSISFEDGAKALSAAVEAGGAKDELYWKYHAIKHDENDPLRSGETVSSYMDIANADASTAVYIHAATPGLAGQVTGFSQGSWDFALYGYKRTDANDTTGSSDVLLYSGYVKNVTIANGATNLVVVPVYPDATQNGKVIVDVSAIKLIKNSDSTEMAAGNGYTIVPVVYNNATNAIMAGSTNNDGDYECSVPAGTYRVSAEFVKDNLVYGQGDVVVTVYSNRTTTVTGTLNERTTYVEFDAEINDNIVVAIGTGTELNGTGTDDASLTIQKTEGETITTIGTAAVPQASVSALIETFAESSTVETQSTDQVDRTIDLTLNIDTTSASATSVVYEIGMTAVLNTTVNNEQTVSESMGAVTSVAHWVTINLELQTGLTGVVVTHSGQAMDAMSSASATPSSDNGGYFYNAENGTLTIKTKSFSPFAVTYNSVADIVYVAKVGSKKYTTLEAAVKSVTGWTEEPVTITLLSNCEGNGIDFGSSTKHINIDIDFNTYTYTFGGQMVGSSGTQTNGFRLLKGSELTLRNGSLKNTSTAGDYKPAKAMINTYGTLTLEDFSIDGTTSLVAESTSVNASPYGVGVLYISNGTTTITGNGVYRAADEHTVRINGEDVVKPCYVILMNNVEGYSDDAVLIFDDDYCGNVYGNVTWGNKQDSFIEIFGGVFQIGIDTVAFEEGDNEVQVVAGTFNFDPQHTGSPSHPSFVADGYCSSDNKDGTWTVIPGGDVSLINEEGVFVGVYSTVQAAIEDAIDGYTIVLLKDAEFGDELSSYDEIYYSLNGYSFTDYEDTKYDGNLYSVGRFAGGCGTDEAPYLITKAEHMESFKEGYDYDDNNGWFWNSYSYTLLNNITLENYTLDVHYDYSEDHQSAQLSYSNAFVGGTFDGGGNTIKYIYRDSDNDNSIEAITIFGETNWCTIKNLIIDCDVETSHDIGLLTTTIYNNVTINNVDVTGIIKSSSDGGAGFSAYALTASLGSTPSSIFKECDCSAKIEWIPGERSDVYLYCAPFVGQGYKLKNLHFVNCSSSGSLVIPPNSFNVKTIYTGAFYSLNPSYLPFDVDGTQCSGNINNFTAIVDDDCTLYVQTSQLEENRVGVVYGEIYDGGWYNKYYSSFEAAFAELMDAESKDVDNYFELFLLNDIEIDLDFQSLSVEDDDARICVINLERHTLSGNINLIGSTLTLVNGTVSANITMDVLTDEVRGITKNCQLQLGYLYDDDSAVTVTGVITSSDSVDCLVVPDKVSGDVIVNGVSIINND